MTLAMALTALTLAAPGEPEFTPLLDGESLAGWTATGDESGWVIEDDGTLLTVGTVDGGWLATDREYADFVLRLEYMLSEVGNSGVLIRGMTEESVSTEVQLLAPWTPRRDDLHCTGSLYGHVAVDPRPDETPLVWHSMEITAVGKLLTVSVDGVEVCRANTDEVESLAGASLSGKIALQSSHSGPDEWVRFRNIRIRDLDAEPGHLAYQLRDEDPAIRRHAQEFAARLGSAMVPELLRLHAEGTPLSVATASEALAWVAAHATKEDGSGGALSAALARELAADWPAQTRKLVLETLTVAGTEDAISPIAASMAHPDLSYSAAAALAAIGGDAARSALAEAIRSDSPGAAIATAIALGSMGAGKGLGALLEASGADEPSVRAAAVNALGRVGEGEASAAAITARLRDPDQAVRAAAQSAACRLAAALARSGHGGMAESLLTRAVAAAEARGQRVSALVVATSIGLTESSAPYRAARAMDSAAVGEARRVAETYSGEGH
jgi:HEAT repeat protein